MTNSKRHQKGTKGSLSFAKSDPALSLASLFRPISRGRRPKGVMLSSPWGEDLTLHFKIHTGLDTTDQSVFLTLVALAAVKGRNIDKRTTSPIGRQLWIGLNDEGDVEYNGTATAFRTSSYEILKEMGLSLGSKNYAALLNCLDRLDGVSFKGETSRFIHPSQKLIKYQIDKDSKDIAIVLNSRICQALTGHYVRIELWERQSLGTDTAKVCHAWLCAWCGAGGSKSIGIDKLQGKIWGVDSSKPSTVRSRRRGLRVALAEIGKIPGWAVSEDGRGIVRIRRQAVVSLAKDV